MRRTLDIIDRVLCFVLVIMLSAMLVVGTMQIVYRYAIEQSLSWSEELLRYLYVWATMLGISLGIRRKSLASIEILSDFVAKHSKLGNNILHTVAFVIQFLVFAVLTVYGVKLIQIAGNQTAPALQWKMAYIYAAFPIGGALALIYTAEEIYDDYFKKGVEVQ